MATLIVVKSDFDIDIPTTCNECVFATCNDGDYGDYVVRCSLLRGDEDDEYPELDVDQYCNYDTRCPRCPIISMNREEDQ